MSQVNPYSVGTMDSAAAFADESARAGFIRRTYTHLAGAVAAFVAIEAIVFNVVPNETMESLVRTMTGGYSWLLVIGAFMGVSWMARSWANSGQSRAMQYAGLGLYVIAQAVIMLPLLYIAIVLMKDPAIPMTAGLITLLAFGGLTAFVFTTRVDMAPWGKYLALAGLIAFGAIAASILIPSLSIGGLVFSSLMVALACGYILYDTSNILHHYRTDQHVAASLALFASVALLFYYVLQLVMSFSSND